MKISFKKLLLAFTAIPFIELFLLFKIAEITSAFTTLAIIILTGILGAYLAKTQGILVFNQIKLDINSGILPKDALINGLCVLIGGILLLTPGVLTDIVGFSLIIPLSRLIYAKHIKDFIKDKFLTTIHTNDYDY